MMQVIEVILRKLKLAMNQILKIVDCVYALLNCVNCMLVFLSTSAKTVKSIRVIQGPGCSF